MIFIELSNVFIPINDYVFKRIFGHVGNEEITKGLLNAILDTEVKEVNLEGNTILERDLADDKLGILDVKAILNNSITCDIEMQLVEKENIEERILFYWSKLYISNIHKSDDYDNLNKCIAILIANFELDNLKDVPKGHTEWKLREKNFPKIVLTEVCEIHIISLNKLVSLIKENSLPKEEQVLSKWVKFLLTPKEMGVIDMENNDALKKAKKEFDTISQDEYEQRLAELRMKNIMDKKAIESHGYKKGVKEGIEQGIEQGEKNRTLEIAKEMLKNGADIDFVIKCTGISKEEVENLK